MNFSNVRDYRNIAQFCISTEKKEIYVSVSSFLHLLEMNISYIDARKNQSITKRGVEKHLQQTGKYILLFLCILYFPYMDLNFHKDGDKFLSEKNSDVCKRVFIPVLLNEICMRHR
jgi:hypothetical protein